MIKAPWVGKCLPGLHTPGTEDRTEADAMELGLLACFLWLLQPFLHTLLLGVTTHNRLNPTPTPIPLIKEALQVSVTEAFLKSPSSQLCLGVCHVDNKKQTNNQHNGHAFRQGLRLQTQDLTLAGWGWVGYRHFTC